MKILTATVMNSALFLKVNMSKSVQKVQPHKSHSRFQFSESFENFQVFCRFIEISNGSIILVLDI